MNEEVAAMTGVGVEDEGAMRPSLPEPQEENNGDGEGNDAINAVVGTAFPYQTVYDDKKEASQSQKHHHQRHDDKEDNLSHYVSSSVGGDDSSAVPKTPASMTPIKRHAGLVPTSMSIGLWNTLEKRQQLGGDTSHWHRKNIHSAAGFSSSSVGTSATSSFTTRQPAEGNCDGTTASCVHPSSAAPSPDVADTGDDQGSGISDDYPMVVVPDKKKKRLQDKRHLSKQKTREGIKKQNQGLKLATIGSTTSEFVNRIQNEEWRKRWRGIHLPPLEARGGAKNGESSKRKKEDAGSVPKQLAAPKDYQHESWEAGNVVGKAPVSSPDTPEAVVQELVAVEEVQLNPDPIPDSVQSSSIHQNPAPITDPTTDPTPYNMLLSSLLSSYSNQPSIPLIPLVIFLLVFYVLKSYFFQKIFTYKKRTLLARSVAEKMSELRYGESSRQFRLSQEDLEKHMRRLKRRNSSKPKSNIPDDDSSSGAGGGSPKDGRGNGDGNEGNEGDMGGGGMGAGGGESRGGGGSSGNRSDNNGNERNHTGGPSNSHSGGPGSGSKGASNNADGSKTSQDTKSNNLATLPCDQLSDQTSLHQPTGLDELLHSANKQLASRAARANKLVEELRTQLSLFKEENAALSQQNASLSQKVIELEVENDEEMESEMELHQQLCAAQQEKSSLLEKMKHHAAVEDRAQTLEEENVALKLKVDLLETENEQMDMEMENFVNKMGERMVLDNDDERKGKHHEGEELEFDNEEEGGSLSQESLTDDDDNDSDDDDDYDDDGKKHTMLQQVATLQSENDALQISLNRLRQDLSDFKSENDHLQRRLSRQQYQIKEGSFNRGDETSDSTAISSDSLISSSSHLTAKSYEALRVENDELQRTLSEVCMAKNAAEKHATTLGSKLEAEQQVSAAKLAQVVQLKNAKTSAEGRVAALEIDLEAAITSKTRLTEQVASLQTANVGVSTKLCEKKASLNEVKYLRVEQRAAAAKVTQMTNLENVMKSAEGKIIILESEFDEVNKSNSEEASQTAHLQSTIRDVVEQLREKEAVLERTKADLIAMKEESSSTTLQFSEELAELQNAKSSLEYQLTTAKERVTALESKCETDQLAASTVLAEMKVKFDAAFESNVDLQQKVASLQSINEDAERRALEKGFALQDAKVSIATMEETASPTTLAFLREVTELHNMKSALEGKVTSLENKLVAEHLAAGTTVAEVEGKLEAATLSNTQLADQVESLQKIKENAMGIQLEEGTVLEELTQLGNVNAAVGEQLKVAEDHTTILKSKLQVERQVVADLSPESIIDQGTPPAQLSRDKKSPFEVTPNQKEVTSTYSVQNTPLKAQGIKSGGNMQNASTTNVSSNSLSQLIMHFEGETHSDAANSNYGADAEEASSKKFRSENIRRLWGWGDGTKKRSKRLQRNKNQ